MFRAVHTYPWLHPSDAPETIECPECGEIMEKRDTHFVLDSIPQQYSWYWGCPNGHELAGGRYAFEDE